MYHIPASKSPGIGRKLGKPDICLQAEHEQRDRRHCNKFKKSCCTSSCLACEASAVTSAALAIEATSTLVLLSVPLTISFISMTSLKPCKYTAGTLVQCDMLCLASL